MEGRETVSLETAVTLRRKIEVPDTIPNQLAIQESLRQQGLTTSSHELGESIVLQSIQASEELAMKTVDLKLSDLVTKSGVKLLVLGTSLLCVGATWGIHSPCLVRVVDTASGKALGTMESRTEPDGDTSFSWRLSDPLYPNGRALRLETLSSSEAAEWEAAHGVTLRVEQRASPPP